MLLSQSRSGEALGSVFLRKVTTQHNKYTDCVVRFRSLLCSVSPPFSLIAGEATLDKHELVEPEQYRFNCKLVGYSDTKKEREREKK